MYTIVPFSIKYTDDLKRFAQQLRNFLTGLDKRLDEPQSYDVSNEVKETIKENIEGKNMMFFYEENEKVYGYILMKIRDEDWEGTSLKKYGKIEELFVDDEYRGKGVSKILLRTAEDYLRNAGVQYMELSVMVGNARARSFYQKMGLLEHQITLAKRLDQ